MPPAERSEPSERRSLRALLSAYAVSQFGNWLFRTGVVYYAYNQNHGSNAVLTTAIVLVYLPILFGSRLLAPLADRRDTRRTLIGLDALRAAVLAVLLVVVSAGAGFTSAATIGVMAFLSLLTPFFTASQTAYLRRVLPDDRLPAALASLSRIDWSMFILGTAAAPLMLQVSDLPTLTSLDIATFVVSGLLLLRLMPAPAVTSARRGSAAAGSGRPRLTGNSRLLLVSVFALNAGAGLINVYPNVVARDFLGGGATWLSVINLANGTGAVIGATLAGRLRKQRGLRPGVLAALVVAGSLACMTFVTNAWVAVPASSVMLAAGQVFAVLFQSRILENEPVAVAGRVSGLFTLGTFAGVTVSILLFMAVTGFGTGAGSVRRSFTVLLLVAAASALASALVGAAALRRHGDRAPGAPDAPDAPDALGAPEDRETPAAAYGASGPDPASAAPLVRQAGRAFATGVTVASTVHDGIPHATTVNSFVTVSLDPALVLVCVERGSRLDALIAEKAPLGITVLSAGQRDTAVHFAKRDRPSGEAQFDGHPWRPGKETGAPLLEAGTAWLECAVRTVVPAGDHSIVLAEVLSFTDVPSCTEPDRYGQRRAPLVFFGGGFHTLAERLPPKQPPAEARSVEQPPAEARSVEQPPAEARSVEQPPAEAPPVEQPPAEEPDSDLRLPARTPEFRGAEAARESGRGPLPVAGGPSE
ncbi:MFS transporter [Kitasatospora sp. NPDC127059]|uniref:MFS transporter n=1 Tax=unclassified Kitasatospora TaxID=2633591 RepID=UPI003665F711